MTTNTVDIKDITNTELHSSLIKLIKEQTQIITAQVADLKNELITANDQISILKGENATLKQKVDRLEILARNNNLVVFGLPYDANEKREELLESTLQKLNQTLTTEFAKRDICDIYRIGRKEKSRPVIIKFSSKFTRDDILKQSSKFSGTGIYIDRDLSPIELNNKKILTPFYTDAKRINLKPRYFGDKLKIGGRMYTADDISELKLMLNTTKDLALTGEGTCNDSVVNTNSTNDTQGETIVSMNLRSRNNSVTKDTAASKTLAKKK